MLIPPTPDNENERLQALYALNMLDTPIQELFERITRLTKGLFQVPIAAFSLIDQDRQWFKSVIGMDVTEIPRDISFCAYTIFHNKLLTVFDAKEEARFAKNPLVTGAPYIRFYAGYPVRNENGENIGTISIADKRPRTFKADDLVFLRDIAALIESEIAAISSSFNHSKMIQELNYTSVKSQVDNLTRLWNKSGIESILENQISHANAHQKKFGIALIDVDNFKEIIEQFDQDAGDVVLNVIAKRLISRYRDFDSVGRLKNERFLVITDFADTHHFFDVAERVRGSIAETPVLFRGQEIPVSITTGLAYYLWDEPCQLSDLIAEAHEALVAGKKHGKNVVAEAIERRGN